MHLVNKIAYQTEQFTESKTKGSNNNKFIRIIRFLQCTLTLFPTLRWEVFDLRKYFGLVSEGTDQNFDHATTITTTRDHIYQRKKLLPRTLSTNGRFPSFYDSDWTRWTGGSLWSHLSLNILDIDAIEFIEGPTLRVLSSSCSFE